MIVLMVGYLRPVDLSNPEREHDILEFYAGAARLSKLGHAMGANAAAMDKNYDSMANEKKKKNNSMDFNTSAGFLSLNFSNGLIIFVYQNVWCQSSCRTSQVQPIFLWLWMADFSPFAFAARLLRLACILILECRFGEFISLMGVACSTWVGISKGSTHRDVALPMGHPHSLAVYRANKAVARSGVKSIFFHLELPSLIIIRKIYTI